jgi:hypothetical protein
MYGDEYQALKLAKIRNDYPSAVIIYKEHAIDCKVLDWTEHLALVIYPPKEV